MRPSVRHHLSEIRKLNLTLESINRSSKNQMRFRRLIREQDEADVRRFNFETTEISAIDGRMVWNILAELRNEEDLRDALLNSWGNDKKEKVVAARKYIWSRVFDEGEKNGERWVIYLPTDKFTYKGVSLKDLDAKELRIQCGIRFPSQQRLERTSVPPEYWWLQNFSANYSIITLIPARSNFRPTEVKIGSLRSTANVDEIYGPENAINGAGFFLSSEGKQVLDENLERYNNFKRGEERQAAYTARRKADSDNSGELSESRKSDVSTTKLNAIIREEMSRALQEAEKKPAKKSSKSSSSKKQEPLPPIPTTTEFEREMRGIISAYHAGEDIEAWLTQDIAGSSASAHGLDRKSGWTGDEDFYRKPSASYIAQHLAANRDPELRGIGQRVLRMMGDRMGRGRFASMGSGFGLDPVDDDRDE